MGMRILIASKSHLFSTPPILLLRMYVHEQELLLKYVNIQSTDRNCLIICFIFCTNNTHRIFFIDILYVIEGIFWTP